ncbi:hypothetical protein ACTXT7_012359 [Hymenolepis weldensis]
MVASLEKHYLDIRYAFTTVYFIKKMSGTELSRPQIYGDSVSKISSIQKSLGSLESFPVASNSSHNLFPAKPNWSAKYLKSL